MPARLTAAAVKRGAAAVQNPARGGFSERSFRTGPGEYGEGDKFLGLPVPEQRRIAETFELLPLRELAKLISSPIHEHRLIALIITVNRHRKGSPEERDALHLFYLANLAGVNNWDLVDTSAAALVGEHIPGNPALLSELVASPNLWLRRIAIISTFAALRSGRTALTFRIAELLLDDKQDLIHKAAGWLLREAGKLDEVELQEFLGKHYARLPRTALRYAIERLDRADRERRLLGPPPTIKRWQ
jgi:3-methyladenine DNA glycosylase AlkD